MWWNDLMLYCGYCAIGLGIIIITVRWVLLWQAFKWDITRIILSFTGSLLLTGIVWINAVVIIGGVYYQKLCFSCKDEWLNLLWASLVADLVLVFWPWFKKIPKVFHRRVNYEKLKPIELAKQLYSEVGAIQAKCIIHEEQSAIDYKTYQLAKYLPAKSLNEKVEISKTIQRLNVYKERLSEALNEVQRLDDVIDDSSINTESKTIIQSIIPEPKMGNERQLSTPSKQKIKRPGLVILSALMGTVLTIRAGHLYYVNLSMDKAWKSAVSKEHIPPADTTVYCGDLSMKLSKEWTYECQKQFKNNVTIFQLDASRQNPEGYMTVLYIPDAVNDVSSRVIFEDMEKLVLSKQDVSLVSRTPNKGNSIVVVDESLGIIGSQRTLHIKSGDDSLRVDLIYWQNQTKCGSAIIVGPASFWSKFNTQVFMMSFIIN